LQKKAPPQQTTQQDSSLSSYDSFKTDTSQLPEKDFPSRNPTFLNAPESTTAISSPITEKPLAKRPARKKSKIILVTPSAQKTKKLTTLDKSVMDWQSHVGSSGDAELEANRRGGGYLDKVEFLQRVDDRKNDVLDASTGTKRRR
jgi:hypothetical protein